MPVRSLSPTYVFQMHLRSHSHAHHPKPLSQNPCPDVVTTPCDFRSDTPVLDPSSLVPILLSHLPQRLTHVTLEGADVRLCSSVQRSSSSAHKVDPTASNAWHFDVHDYVQGNGSGSPASRARNVAASNKEGAGSEHKSIAAGQGTSSINTDAMRGSSLGRGQALLPLLVQLEMNDCCVCAGELVELLEGTKGE